VEETEHGKRLLWGDVCKGGREMAWVDPAESLREADDFRDSVYDLYDAPTEEERVLLNRGKNPWRGTQDNPRETLDCDEVQRFLVWCAYHGKHFTLRYASNGGVSKSVKAKVYLNVRRYPNICADGGYEIGDDGENPFVFTHRRNENVWCLVAWIKERSSITSGATYRWVTAREYNSVDQRSFPRVTGASENFYRESVFGPDAQRDNLEEEYIDEGELQEDYDDGGQDEDVSAVPAPPAADVEEPEVPIERRVTRSMAARVRADAAPVSSRLRSRTNGTRVVVSRTPSSTSGGGRANGSRLVSGRRNADSSRGTPQVPNERRVTRSMAARARAEAAPQVPNERRVTRSMAARARAEAAPVSSRLRSQNRN